MDNMSQSPEQENQLEDLSFESDKKKSGSNFLTILTFVLFILFGSIAILGYYLFVNNSNQSLTTTVEKIEPNLDSINYKLLSSKSDYQVSIYLSQPRKEIRYIGQGIVVGKNTVLTSSEVIKNNNSNELVVVHGGSNIQVTSMQGSLTGLNANLWFLILGDDSKLPEPLKILEKELSIGDDLYLKTIRRENKDSDILEEIISVYPLKITGISEDKSIYLTNLKSSDFGNPVYDKSGNLVGITSVTDSGGNIRIVAGNTLKRVVLSVVQTQELDNKSKLGIDFEFSDLDKFRREGRPVGLIVGNVENGKVGQVAGIKKDDIILTINNQVIVSQEELYNLFNNLNPGEELRFEIVREDKKIGITLNLE